MSGCMVTQSIVNAHKICTHTNSQRDIASYKHTTFEQGKKKEDEVNEKSVDWLVWLCY